jgi:hypothetical protein
VADPVSTWTLYTRAATGAIEAQIDDYQGLEVTSRFNAVGTWLLDVDYRSAPALRLAQPGMGIYLIRDDTVVVFSGWVTSIDRKRDKNTNRATFAGKDDMLWLAARRASPVPSAMGPPYSAAAYDVRTGVCSTVLRQYVDVNAGPSAVPERRVLWGGLGGLTLGADPVVGATVTKSARWQNLLELLQELAVAGGDIGFRVQHTGVALEFQTYQPSDKSNSIRFSHELGTLAGYGFTAEIPEVNYVYVAGQGEGTARTIIERADEQSVVTHGRFEEFMDRRDTADAAELAQAGTETLTDKTAKVGLSLTPVDVPGQTYGVHYDLGDQVSTYLDETPVVERIREVKLVFNPDGPLTITPTVGTPTLGGLVKLFDQLQGQNQRLSTLERR